MKNSWLWVIVLGTLFQVLPAEAQYYYYNNRFYDNDINWQAGFTAGAMNCLTDLGGKGKNGRPFLKDVQWEQTKRCWGVYSAIVYKRRVGLRMEANFGRIAAADIPARTATQPNNRSNRNLSIETKISEILVLVEMYPLTLLPAFQEIYVINPYFLTGVGCFHFNPFARYGGSNIALRSLHTEGQGFPEFPERKPYALNQLNFVFGWGLTWEASALFLFSADFTYRKLFTDYLDDVSSYYINPAIFDKYLPPDIAAISRHMADRQVEINPRHITAAGDKRGNPENKDAYFSIQVKAAIVLNRERRSF